MKDRVVRVSLLFLVAALLMNAIGCSMFSRPSDAQILKAIDDSGILKGKSFTVVSPLTIVERGKQNKDGSWPVRIKMTLTMQFPDGKISEPKENTANFRIMKEKDGTGRRVWKAVLG